MTSDASPGACKFNYVEGFVLGVWQVLRQVRLRRIRTWLIRGQTHDPFTMAQPSGRRGATGSASDL